MKKIVLLFLTLIITNSSLAKDLGVWGTVYPIAEEDFREVIYRRLGELQKNGELAKMKETFIKNVSEHSLRPVPVANVTTTENPKTFYYDPTFTLERNLEDANGNILFAAGTKVNPLDKVQLHSVWFFLDSDDQRQIAWAQAESKKYDYVKFILMSGNIKAAGDALKSRIYFDQNGKLTQKLEITHIPCVVQQEGKRLMMQEVRLKN